MPLKRTDQNLTCLQDLAQRAVVAYVRSVFLQPRKEVFNVRVLPLEEYALSIGLPTLPRMRFLSRQVCLPLCCNAA